MKGINDLLGEYRELAFDERHKGSLFEDLIKNWLEIDSFYSTYFQEVLTFSEWAKRNGKSGTDTGIDLIAIDQNDGVWAIQCKFYEPSSTLEKKDIDSFFTASGKKPYVGRMIFSTTDHWSKNAEEALEDQQIPVLRIRVQDLDNSNIDWGRYSFNKPSNLEFKPKKKLRAHQVEALESVIKYFESSDRGKLVMACGTGKTLTSLRIAEKMISDQGIILYLVPSISLMSQTLTEWVNESNEDFDFFAVCSDVKVGKRQDEDIQVMDLTYPATTDAKKLITSIKNRKNNRKIIIFSTYQSINVISEAQKNGLGQLDAIICDEAHRTTGVTLSGESESHFVKVHDDSFISAKKRLYMTATPRIYSDAVNKKADEINAVAISMDNTVYYGEEIYRLNFGEAVKLGLLSDYKVIILTVSENSVNRQMQNLLLANSDLNLDDASKIVGCINGLLKHGNDPDEFNSDPSRMKTAVAFARSIAESKRISNLFGEVAQAMSETDSTFQDSNILMEHVDGTFNVLARNEKLDWLKKVQDSETRILSNAKCLSEGIDVPALDAVLFLNPRESLVDIVQSVGRVMRKSEGKKYGYVILPITLPAGKDPEAVLNDNKSFKVVWQVLQALRAHDETFDAIVNKINLNGSADEKINIIGIGLGEEDSEGLTASTKDHVQFSLSLDLSEWKDAILAKLVSKVGNQKYWEDWAKDVADIAQRSIIRISSLVTGGEPSTRKEFAKFLKGLQDNLNPSVSEKEAIEMLAQHLITKPIFEALFRNYDFTDLNPVSKVMQGMLRKLEKANLSSELNSLDPFYESVRLRASGINTQEGRQHIVKELYEKFFKFAFPSTAESLGIVYTPLEVVDFIINSIQWALKNSFNQELKDPNVHILDPFTGTGTFIVRLLQSGLIPENNIADKYKNAIHANEIVLLAYYVAAINIEETYFSLQNEYQPFNGIVLTDTFQMTEGKDSLDIEGIFPDNNDRVKKQNDLDIKVIMGNPPYSVGRSSDKLNSEKFEYPDLNKSISDSYLKKTNADVKLKQGLYDSYFRAFRWSTNRIGNSGVICFVTNGSWIDSNIASGFRSSLIDEFNDIYVLNLRGNARTMGELRRKEGGNVFSEGSKTPISITLLIRNPDLSHKGRIHYQDIGDYKTTTEKLEFVKQLKSFGNGEFIEIVPNKHSDWINQRRDDFETFIPIADKENKNDSAKALFSLITMGIMTGKDPYVYNSNRGQLSRYMKEMINIFNQSIDQSSPIENLSQIKWDRKLLREFSNKRKVEFDEISVRRASYRPFAKTNLYFSKTFVSDAGQNYKLFPNADSENLVITLNEKSSNDFSAFITDAIPDLHFNGDSQCLPLYIYHDKKEEADFSLFDDRSSVSTGITPFALNVFRKTFNSEVSSEDIFYYVYGILWNPDYLHRFKENLKKELPRIPLTSNFSDISNLGRELSGIHLNYSKNSRYKLKVTNGDNIENANFKVNRIKWDSKAEKLTVVLNDKIRITDFPKRTNELLINGRNPIDWVVERYNIVVHPSSGIVNDPQEEISNLGGMLNLLESLAGMVEQHFQVIEKMPVLDIISKRFV